MNTLHQADCIATMKSMEAESVDVIVTDPPYLINYNSGSRTKALFDGGGGILSDSRNEDEKLITEYFEQCHRILKPNTHIYSFCSWHHVDFFKQEFEKLFDLKNIIIWHKPGGGMGDLKGSFSVPYEFVLFGHKGRRELKGKRIESIWTFPKVTGSKMVHPTEKPVPLMTQMIAYSSNEGDTVFDGFMGSGSTGVAANSINRNFIGCELDPRFYEIAQQRMTAGITSFM